MNTELRLSPAPPQIRQIPELCNPIQNLNLKLRLSKPYKGHPTLLSTLYSLLSTLYSLSTLLSLLKLAVYSATAGNRPKPQSKHS